MNHERFSNRTLVPVLGVPMVGSVWFTHIILRQAHGLEPSRGVGMLAGWASALLVVLWVRNDYRRSRYWPCFEYDMFMLLGWPLLLPHYLFHTRGARGLGIYAAMLGILVGCAILTAVIAMALGVMPE